MNSAHVSALISAGLTIGLASVCLPAFAASEAVIYVFKGGERGHTSYAPLIQVGPKLYGTTSGTVFSLTLTGKEKVLHAFAGCSDGFEADTSLTRLNGTLYGLTFYGGDPNCSLGSGTAYAATPKGAYSVLYSFSEASGFEPGFKLTALNGALYGTTLFGGGGDDIGTMFSLTPRGGFQVLYHFDYSTGRPESGLTALDGDFYGVTDNGGAGNHGTVYRITTTGAYKQIYSFQGSPDGDEPAVDLINVNGTLYGITANGGTGNCDSGSSYGGCGTIFAVTPQGAETVLYSFPQQLGASSLIYVDGIFYGTTFSGGGSGCGGNGCGTVFSVTPAGEYSTIYDFKGGIDGSQPRAALLNVGGVLYGTTESGGNDGCKHHLGCGTVFTITP